MNLCRTFYLSHFVIFILLFNLVFTSEDWSYDDKSGAGPEKWCTEFPICCGKTQSPLDISDDKKSSKLNTAFTFTGYDAAPRLMSLHNGGHSVILSNLDTDVAPKLSGGLLNHTYYFHSLHFHWGKSSEVGSEHSIAGQKFPLEMHMVHYSSQYGSINHAFRVNKPDAIAVLGILFKIDPENNPVLDRLVKKLRSIPFSGQVTNLKNPFNISSLFPSETGKFYRYFGSLTTPPCYEAVVWNVFEVTNTISENQLNAFRDLYATIPSDTSRHKISGNFRPVQQLNTRVVDHFVA